MIEAYAFLAMFIVQIVTMSVLHPARLAKYSRMKLAEFPAESFPQLHSHGALGKVSNERFLSIYLRVNAGVAVVGALLLAFMFYNVPILDWDRMTAFYFLLQAAPMALLAVIGIRYLLVYRSSLLEGKRKAILQRRGVFDFVSPYVVAVAVAGFFVSVAYMLNLGRHPNIGFKDVFIALGSIALVHALSIFQIYMLLYGKKLNPLDTPSGHLHMIGVSVKSAVYACIFVVAFMTLIFTLRVLELHTWKPFAISTFMVFCGVLCLTAFNVPRSNSEIKS